MTTTPRDQAIPKPREEGGGGLNPSSKEVGKRGIGRKNGNGLNSCPKPLVAQRAGGIQMCIYIYIDMGVLPCASASFVDKHVDPTFDTN